MILTRAGFDHPIGQRPLSLRLCVAPLNVTVVEIPRDRPANIPELGVHKYVVKSAAHVDLSGVLILVPYGETLFRARVQSGKRVDHGLRTDREGVEPCAVRYDGIVQVSRFGTVLVVRQVGSEPAHNQVTL